MAALDHMDVKEGVDQETVDAVREVGGAYKYGWDTEIEMEYAPKGVNPDIVRLISEKNDEPRLDDRVAFASFCPLGANARAGLGDGQLPEDRFSGPILLRAPQIND